MPTRSSLRGPENRNARLEKIAGVAVGGPEIADQLDAAADALGRYERELVRRGEGDLEEVAVADGGTAEVGVGVRVGAAESAATRGRRFDRRLDAASDSAAGIDVAGRAAEGVAGGDQEA